MPNISKPSGELDTRLNRELRGVEYSLVLKAVVVILLSAAVYALITVWLIDGLLEKPFIGGAISFFQSAFELDYFGAEAVYERVFSSNKLYWGMAGFCPVLAAGFYMGRRWLCVDYRRILSRMDAIVTGEEAEPLPESLSFAGKRLAAIEALIEKKEHDAKTAEQRKNDLITYLAHDIKTPLTSIIGYLNLLDESKDLSRQQTSRYVGVTLEKSYHLEQLINEFFDITRFNLQTIVLNRQELDLRRMLEQLSDEFFPLLEQQDKRIAIDAPEVMLIRADADKLGRVFNNILKNALSHSYPGTELDVCARWEGDSAVISFINTGDTIPPEGIEMIFEKFYRLDAARSSDTGGAGLGLAIAKEIVAAHGGCITAQSEDHKTVFTVIIPLSY